MKIKGNKNYYKNKKKMSKRFDLDEVVDEEYNEI